MFDQKKKNRSDELIKRAGEVSGSITDTVFQESSNPLASGSPCYLPKVRCSSVNEDFLVLLVREQKRPRDTQRLSGQTDMSLNPGSAV